VLVLLQAVAFAGCVLVDLIPGTEVDCHFGLPIAAWGAPAPSGADTPLACPVPSPDDGPQQCSETAG
jgi:hypothetical protein